MNEKDFYGFVVELIDFRKHKEKKIYEVSFSIVDNLSDRLTKNTYKFYTPYSRLNDSFLVEFLSQVTRRVGEYVFFMDDRKLFYIESRHILIFNVRPHKRINFNIRRMMQIILLNKKYVKTASGVRLELNNTHIFKAPTYLMLSPVDKSKINMKWFKKYQEQHDYNLVQTKQTMKGKTQ